MKMFKQIILSSIAIILASCSTIFEYPEGTPVDPTYVNLSLKLSLTPESLLDFEDNSSSLSSSIAYEDSLQIRTIVEIYSSSNLNEPVAREVYHQSYLDIQQFSVQDTFALNATQYKILIWADIVDNTEDRDLYYLTSDLRNIAPNGTYVGSNDFKQCLAKYLTIDLSPYKDEWNAIYEANEMLQSPLARFEIISNDLDEFLSEETTSLISTSELANDDLSKSSGSKSEESKSTVSKLDEIDISKYTVKLMYDGFMPYGYNVETDLPNKAETGIQYTASLEQLSSTEALLSFDHILVSNSESSVNVTLTIYDEDGDMVKQTNSTNIQLIRNQKTVIVGDFLTQSYEPGLSIDPSFDGDIYFPVD